MDDLTLALAYQAQDFFDSEHPWTQEITASQKQTISQYLRNTVRPVQSYTSGRQTCSKSKEASTWPREWTTNLSKLKQDIDYTVQAIQASSTESETHSPATTSDSNQTEPPSYTEASSYQRASFKPSKAPSSKGTEREAQGAMASNERAGQTG